MSGTWLVTGSDPVFTVADVGRSVAFYAQLGFAISRHDETYAFAHRDRGLTIHLARAEGDAVPGRGSLYIHCHDADRVAEDWRTAGVDVAAPRDQDHGRREGVVADPDGNLIRFGSPLRLPVPGTADG